MVVGHGEREGYRGHASACGSPYARTLGGLFGRLPFRSLAALGTLLVAMVLGSAPALAISQRGHVFSFAFGGEGKGEGQLRLPTGVAVNDTTGDVYVADRSNNRIEQFEPVMNSKGELSSEKFVREFPVTAPRDIAIDNSHDAADPSKEDVYVVAPRTAKTIFKFTSTGEPLGQLNGPKPKQKFEAIQGITVDSSGDLFVYQQGVVDRFNTASTNVFQSEVPLSLTQAAKSGLAIDSEGDFYVGVQTTSQEAEQHAAEEGREATAVSVIARVSGTDGSVLLPELDGEITTAVAVNPANEPANDVSELNDVYVTNLTRADTGKNATTVGQFRIRPPEGGEPERDELIQRFSAPGLEEGNAVAVDSKTGVVYVADAASNKVDVFALEPAGPPTVEGLSSCTMSGLQGAICPSELDATTLNAQVDPTGADTHYSFEYGTSNCEAVPSSCTKTASTDVGGGFGDRPVSLPLSSLQPGKYFYRIIAENDFGVVTSVESSFVVIAPSNALPDGREWELVSPANKGGAEPEPITSEGGLIQASADGRAIAYVADGPMPLDQAPEGSRSPEPTQVLSTRSLDGWSSQDLNTPNDASLGIGSATAPEYQAFSPNLALSIVEPFVGAPGSGALERPPLSPPAVPGEEQQKTIYLRDDKPLEPEVAGEESYDAAKHNGELMSPANPGYLALVTSVNSPRKGTEAEPFGGGGLEGLEFQTATPDLSHVLFLSRKAAPGLYEWNGRDEPVLPVSVLPEQTTPVMIGNLGSATNFTAYRNMISEHGSRVVWTDAGRTHLYVRDTLAGKTLQLDTLNGGPGEGEGKPVFQTASTDGSKVFFTDTQRLTANSHAGAFFGHAAPDLYVAEVSGGGSSGSPLSSTLTDLTAGQTPGNVIVSRGTGGGVIGASENGSYVYFVANGVLTSGATRGGCTSAEEEHPIQATCNLYMSHHVGGAWTTKLVGVLAAEDQSDWGEAGEGNLAFLTARVSPSGQFLAFMSNRSLTGYDNEDQSSQKKRERLDEEVFLFNADAESGANPLVCASCNPTGARPVGMFDAGIGNSSALSPLEEGRGLVVDRRNIFSLNRKPADHWLAGSLPGWTSLSLGNAPYQSRYLSDEGRLFFNSADALAPLAKPTKRATVFGKEQDIGIENVYEYQPGGLGSCASTGGCVTPISSGTSEHESAFLDASVSGNDVYFITASQLAPQDVDGINDVYDAHVCEASAPCLPTPPPPAVPCDEQTQGSPACRESPPPVPAFGEPASRASSGSGSGAAPGLVSVLPSKAVKPTTKPPTRAQKLAKALKLCKKDKKKSKRLACEKLAKKRFGPIKHAPAKKSAVKGTNG